MHTVWENQNNTNSTLSKTYAVQYCELLPLESNEDQVLGYKQYIVLLGKKLNRDQSN